MQIDIENSIVLFSNVYLLFFKYKFRYYHQVTFMQFWFHF